jgi:tRNA(Ile)-lysidine synthase
MNIQLEPGTYVVAVSGGVDSVSLLRALRDLPGTELVVAHFDHGIRPDSAADREFVGALADRYGLPFIYEEGRLGPRASEATARAARYDFLERARNKYGAVAIITAHHQDDVLETAIINMLRGTGRKGLSALADRPRLRRPLLKLSKQDIRAYADAHQLRWQEDSTNSDETYLRNYVRRRLLPRFSETDRAALLSTIEKSAATNMEIDTLLVKYLSAEDKRTLDRQQFSSMPHEVATEIMAAWLRAEGIRDFDSKTLDRLVIAGKTARPGSRFDVAHAMSMKIGKGDLALVAMER